MMYLNDDHNLFVMGLADLKIFKIHTKISKIWNICIISINQRFINLCISNADPYVQ